MFRKTGYILFAGVAVLMLAVAALPLVFAYVFFLVSETFIKEEKNA